MAPASLVDVPPRPARLVRRLGAILLMLLLLAVCANPASAQSVTDPDLDSDGDGIMNSHDPDDDNDGITDDIDPAPFDASIPGSAPPPSSIDPDADSDGDGIFNSHDPDDDNDSWVDASDPVVFDPDNTLPASGGGDSGGSGGSGVDGSGASARASSVGGTSSRRGGVYVTRLPNTGIGDGGHSGMPWPAIAMGLSAFGTVALAVASAQCLPGGRFRRFPVMRR